MADPNYAPMYGELRRRVKTDRRDVAALAEANRRGWYRAAHRRSRARSGRLQPDAAQSAAARGRCGRGAIALVRALLRQEGYRAARRASAARVPARLARLAAPGGARARRSRRCGG